MKNAIFSLLCAALLASCQQTNSINTPSDKDSAPVVAYNGDNSPQDGKKTAEWMQSRKWVITEYRPNEGERFFYVDAPVISISNKGISYPELCNTCHYEVEIDTKKRLLRDIHKGSGICTELECLDYTEMRAKGMAVPPRPSKEFGKWVDYEYRKEGDYLVLKASHGEYWLRLAPDFQNPPKSLINTRWECYSYQKNGSDKTQYVDEPIHIGFGKDYLSYSPDCNSCTMSAAMSYDGGKIGWVAAPRGFTCTEMACLGNKNKDFDLGTITPGMQYRFENGILILENEKIRLFLRQQVF